MTNNSTTGAVSFSVSAEEASLIEAIVNRAEEIAEESAIPFDRMSMHMDITACHANGSPLRLYELARADRFDFVHDVFGICRNIDRRTGRLMNCFLPRYSHRELSDSPPKRSAC